MSASTTRFHWALLSAAFAALTAIFAKIGTEGVNSDLATLIRTGVIIVVLSLFVFYTGKWSNPLALSPGHGPSRCCPGWPGASWVCYFRALKIGDASKVAPVDKLSLLLVAVFAVIFLGERPSLRRVGRHPAGRRWRAGAGFQTLTGAERVRRESRAGPAQVLGWRLELPSRRAQP